MIEMVLWLLVAFTLGIGAGQFIEIEGWRKP